MTRLSFFRIDPEYMSPEDKIDPKEIERQKLLEEIRQRAEEAELKRIESEEERSGLAPAAAREPRTPTSPEVTREPKHTPAPSPPERAIDEHRLIDLRGRFAVAIDREDLDSASDLILEIAGLIPGSVELNSYQEKLRALRRKLREQREPSPPPPPPPVEPPMDDRKRQSREKKIKALMEESMSLYEQEKYDQASSTVEELLAFDPENEDAADLRSKILKAQELAAEVRAEEERRKAELGKVEEPEPEVYHGQDGDFWASKEGSPQEESLGIEVDENAPAKPPRKAIAKKLVERAARIRVPVKPVVVTSVMILAIVGGFFLAKEIQLTAGDMSSSILVLPGWHSPSDSLAEVLSYALMEELTEHLSSVSDLRVISPHSAASVQYVRGGPAGAARTLGVQYYLHWNIKTTPASVTFDFSLRDTAGVDPLWTTGQQSSIRELPAAMGEVATSVLEAMELIPEGSAARPAMAGMSSNPDALLRFFTGRSMLGKPEAFSPASAGALFDEAIRLDPEFRLARVARAWTLLREAESSMTASKGLVTDAMKMLAVAGEEGATAPEHLAAIGLGEQLEGRYERAKEYFDMGVRYYPADAELRRRDAVVSLIRGDQDAALDNARKGTVLDPLSEASWKVLATIERNGGDARGALPDFLKAAELSPNKRAFTVTYLPEVLVATQRHEEAETILADEIGRSRDSYVLHYRLGRVLQAAGKPIARWEEQFHRARTILERHLSASPDDAVARSYLALVFTRLGKQQEAEVELNRALRDKRSPSLVFYNAARVYAMQRNDEAALEQLDKAIGIRYDLDQIADMDLYNLQNKSEFVSVVLR